MAIELEVVYRFYPVGQGLFASGSLYAGSNQPRFSWVYDCGTVSSQELLETSLVNLRNRISAKSNSEKPKIDLVVVSHFDWDHISGLVRLLENFSVGTLLLPYMPLWQRLALAFSEGIDTQQALMSFFVNPVAYLTGLEDVSIERLAFVPGSGREGPAAPPEDPTQIPEPTDAPWPLSIEAQQPDGEEMLADFLHFSQGERAQRMQVRLLRAGSSLRVAKVWEFVPYNDVELAPSVNKEFRDSVTRRREVFLRANNKEAWKAALAELREAYDKHFGRRKRNLASLFLYSGQLGAHHSKYLYLAYENWEPDGDSPTIWYWRGRQLLSKNRTSALYTGDGYLDTPDRLDRLIKYVGDKRIKQLTCLQVMHHGSRRNWHEGVARQLAPDTSVFCAAPDHKRFRHPHAEVVRDFLQFGPCLVDKSHGLTVWFRAS